MLDKIRNLTDLEELYPLLILKDGLKQRLISKMMQMYTWMKPKKEKRS